MILSSNNEGYNYSVSSEENEELLKANVVVYNHNYNSFLGIKLKKHNTYGSGFVFKEDSNNYYVLTNNHVVSPDYSFNNNEIFIEDYYGNKYEGKVINRSSEYDLAIVKFSKEIELNVLEIVSDDSVIGEKVKSMGNPSSTKNVINDGKVSCYSIVNINNERSNIQFDVLVHSAVIKNGSSGSALLNEENEVIGVTFAGVFDKDENFITGYAIPASKINEFLSK